MNISLNNMTMFFKADQQNIWKSFGELQTPWVASLFCIVTKWKKNKNIYNVYADLF